MNSKYIDLTGKKFGRLKVLRISNQKDKKRGRLWVCECECGNKIERDTHCLISGHTRSCGCLQKDTAKKIAIENQNLVQEHQMQNLDYQRIRGILNKMKSRCYKPQNNRYKNYGARGIKICDEWNGDDGIKNFYDWAMNNEYRKDLSIDRIDVNGNYEPSNCRWVGALEQCNNRTTNHFIKYNDEIHTIAEWSRKFKVNAKIMRYRLMKSDWSLEKAILKYNMEER